MTDPSHLPATIRARVHDGAIDRVTRFFDAGLAQAFTELIQNSRRSSATRVAVTAEAIEQDRASPIIRVTVSDDGDGIADPAVLLSFGESGWDQDTARREDPAGMGVYALSKRGCTISSRARGPLLDLAPGWRVALTPECFLGKEDAAVVEGDAPWPHGTAISFIAHESLVMIQGALAGAALHCPLPVTFNGEACKRKAFLDGAVHTERWRGLAFGVFRNRLAGFNDPDLNFHGLTLSVRLPSVDPVEGGAWSVRADVEACPELELVLPARREAVETEFLKEMRDAARLAVSLARPDRIDMHLRIERGDQPPETMTVPADVAFVGEDGAWVEDVRPLVTRDSKLTPMQLTRLLHASYFSPSDDVEADSYDTQSARFDQDATHLAIKLLATEDEARKHTIAEAVWREIIWVMPRDREVSIKVSGGKVAVEFGPETAAPEGVAA